LTDDDVDAAKSVFCRLLGEGDDVYNVDEEDSAVDDALDGLDDRLPATLLKKFLIDIVVTIRVC